MIDYVDMKITVNGETEIERAVGMLSHMCAEAYVGPTVPYNPSWCTVEVHLGDYDEEGSHEVGLVVITVQIKDAPLLRGLIDHVLGMEPDFYDLHEYRDLSEAYESLERADEEARMWE